ncbi:MAG TPA: hypothetical protein VF660_00790 [Actinomycetota bacterium]|jgi:hypothetical protein
MASRKRTKKPAKRPADVPAKGTGRDICFVIMPFGGWLDDYYETIYAPAIEAVELEPHRADDLYRPSTIVNDIWSYTQRAKLLLADLTGKNPNVFYELGLAHALGKPAILVAESMDDIPFDLRALRIIVYDKNDPRWGERLQEKVQTSITEVLKAPQEAVLPAFLHVRPAAAAPSVTLREKDIIEIKQELDLLRREIRRVPVSGRIINPREARFRIEQYLGSGLSEEAIIRRLRTEGPPESWIREQINEVRAKSASISNRVDETGTPTAGTSTKSSDA